MAAMSERTGFPTQVPAASPSVAGKPVSTRLATLASQRLVRPATAFCSCRTSGLLNSPATSPPGPETNPPMPSNTSGFRRRRINSAWEHATRSRNGMISLRPRPLWRSPSMWMASRSNPSAATSRDSNPLVLPIQRTSTPRSLRHRATARAGITCPPVPPAITIIRLMDTSGARAGTAGPRPATAPAPASSPGCCCHRSSSTAG